MNRKEEALLILQEECAEVIQACAKIKRFGEESRWPDEFAASTQECLEMEVGQVLAMIDILIERGQISDSAVNEARHAKKEKLKVWSNLYK
jgi:NTP pyrophosphatase (non-canonical NTP hydrolase)